MSRNLLGLLFAGLLCSCASLPPDQRGLDFVAQAKVDMKAVVKLLYSYGDRVDEDLAWRISANRDTVGLAPSDALYLAKLSTTETGRLFLINAQVLDSAKEKEAYLAALLSGSNYLSSEKAITLLPSMFAVAASIKKKQPTVFPDFIEGGASLTGAEENSYIQKTFEVRDKALYQKQQ